VSYVSTTVDRIIPRTTNGDLDAVARLTGRADHAPVVTVPFREWVLAGDFPGGRPTRAG
jgi:fructuronate reductase